jgi:hypothetical protein
MPSCWGGKARLNAAGASSVTPVSEILAVFEAVQGVGMLVQGGNWLRQYLQKVGRDRKAKEVREFLERLGSTGEHEVRHLVEGWRPTSKVKLTEEECEWLIALLVNLTRKARFITTQGASRSSILRSQALLEQLMSDIQPVRQKGQHVAENYDWTLERYLGAGTFGEVWMARNPYFFPPVRAYKFFTRPDALHWVRKEQESLKRVKELLGDHRNVIKFEDVVIGNSPMPFLGLEYAGGGSLEDWILEDKNDRPHLNKHDVIAGLVDGLATAHAHEIYHCDLKPANVVLTDGPNPVAKITDFGLGKVAAQVGSAASSLATQSLVVGTAIYLPPEAQDQLVERDPAQDDVFAMGVLWYQLLVERLERPPYDFADALRAEGVDSHTIGLISRCMARPKYRFKHAGELANSLEQVGLPTWDVPAGYYDIQPLFREFHASRIAP